MPWSLAENELSRRLAWLLVFRATIATALLGLTLIADLANWRLKMMAPVLYAVVIVTYVVVFGLGILLRTRKPPIVLSAVYLAAVVLSSPVAVHATGGVESAFTFLYLLAILDGALIGGRTASVTAASAGTLLFGTSLVLQMYALLPAYGPSQVPSGRYANVFIVHLAAFYLTALLSGHLAEMFRRARDAASAVAADLAVAEALHAQVLASLPLGVITFDSHLIVNTANEAGLTILAGWGSGRIGERLPSFLADFVLRGGQVGEIERGTGYDEQRLYVRLAAIRGSKAVGTARPTQIMVLEDRTEIRRLESHLATKERLATLGELAAAIAHEIRNPLTAISGSLELMADGPSNNDHGVKLRRIVSREIARLDHLVEDFLTYARPASPHLVVIDMVPLVQDLAAVAGADRAGGEPTLEVEAPEHLEAQVDPSLVRQMLWNLVKNALEASYPRGRVVLRLAPGERPDAELRLEVVDQGCGISEQVRGSLFTPFHTTKSSGSGLGMAIVQRIVEAHRGHIEVASVVGQGTSVCVCLPRSLNAGASAQDLPDDPAEQ